MHLEIYPAEGSAPPLDARKSMLHACGVGVVGDPVGEFGCLVMYEEVLGIRSVPHLGVPDLPILIGHLLEVVFGSRVPGNDVFDGECGFSHQGHLTAELAKIQSHVSTVGDFRDVRVPKGVTA